MSLSRKLATLLAEERATPSSVVEILTKYNMLSLLPSIRQALIQVASQESKKDTIMIESPFPISDTALKKVRSIVGNDTAEHEVVINQKILAGFKARFQGMLYDGSAERIIKQLTGSH